MNIQEHARIQKEAVKIARNYQIYTQKNVEVIANGKIQV